MMRGMWRGLGRARGCALRTQTRCLLTCKDTKGSSWNQTGSEISLRIPVPSECRGRDVNLSIKPTQLTLQVSGEEHVSGSFESPVDPDESFWSIEEDADSGQRYVQVVLEKTEGYLEWEHVFVHDLPPPGGRDRDKRGLLRRRGGRRGGGEDHDGPVREPGAEDCGELSGAVHGREGRGRVWKAAAL